jgi:uncharacterized repeat protein (TIGR01451 family)
VNQPIDSIRFNARANPLTLSGTSANNVVKIESFEPDGVTFEDISPEAIRTDARAVSIGNPVAFAVAKRVATPFVEMDDPLNYELSYANTSPDPVLTTDIIDILPFEFPADTRVPLTDYTNSSSLAMTGIVRTGGTQPTTFSYTKAPLASLSDDPGHVSNLGGGTTTWCTALSGGACPSSLAEVTAVRILGGSLPSGASSKYVLSLAPVGNRTGDRYVNRYNGRVQGIVLPVTSNNEVAMVVDSSVGNRVWNDLNNDGIQDPGEPGLVGVSINIVGYSFGPNGVDNGNAGDDEPFGGLSTITGADGLYTFAEMHSGRYTVTLDASTLPAALRVKTFDLDDGHRDTGFYTTAHNSGSFVLHPDTDRVDVDFGYTRLDLALRKTVNTTLTPTPISVGSRVIYSLEVFNQGSSIVRDIVVTDTVPTGLEFDPSNPVSNGWILVSGRPTLRIEGALFGGTSTTLLIGMKIANGTAAGTSIVNAGEIASMDDDGDPLTLAPIDIDSTPDTTAGNTPGEAGAVDDALTGAGGDEDDHDIASVVVCPALTITGVPNGTVGMVYGAAPTATGTGPFAWTAVGLPAGLTMNPGTGAITGTPTMTGVATITATDSAGCQGSVKLAVFNACCGQLTVILP